MSNKSPPKHLLAMIVVSQKLIVKHETNEKEKQPKDYIPKPENEK
jgi:hypothetical protein